MALGSTAFLQNVKWIFNW